MTSSTDALLANADFDAMGGAGGAPSTAAYEPPAIAPSLIELGNRLSRRRTPIAFALGDAAIAFTPVGLGSIRGAVPLQERVTLSLRLDDHPLALQMSKSLFERLLARVDPELLAAETNGELLPLLLESCMEDGLKAAETALQARLELHGIGIGRSLDLHGLDLALEIGLDGEPAGRASLRAAWNDVERLAAAFEAGQKPPRTFGDLAVELSFRAGSLWLDLGELRTLKVGDMLLADRDAARWDRMAATIGERWILPIELNRAGPVLRAPLRRADPRDRDEWMMAEPGRADGEEDGLGGLLGDVTGDRQARRTPRRAGDARGRDGAGGERGRAGEAPAPEEAGLDESGLDEADLGPAPSPADAAFDELPIKLVFELGRTEMPLGRLQEIGPGYVFELDRPLGEAVEIHAGNRRIGQGEVVRIDDQVGVRVLRLFGRERG